MSSAQHGIGDFFASHGAPFYELQLRAGLIRRDSLCVRRRALIAIALCWAVPALISALEGHATGPVSETPFLLDPVSWARFFIAIGAFILAEQMTERSHLETLRQFQRAVLAPASFAAAAEAVLAACRQRDSRIAEGACLAAALLISFLSYHNLLAAGAASWALEAAADGVRRVTLAAWWCLLVSGPMFWFLLLRTVWRAVVWSVLLRRLGGLELRLVSTHPDGNGGLGFVGQVPNAYTLFVLGVSCVVSAALIRHGLQQQLTTTTLTSVLAGWLAFVLALLAFPLTAFLRPLARLKQETLAQAGVQAIRFHRAQERKTLGLNIAAPDPKEAEAEGEVADPSKQFDTTRKLSVSLFNRSALVPVAAAAILPLAGAAAAQLPYKDLLNILKKLLLL